MLIKEKSQKRCPSRVLALLTPRHLKIRKYTKGEQMEHYTKTKEEKTTELMKRVLNILIDAPEPIELNKKKYRKINFSQGQVLDALHHYATPEEQIEGIVFKNASTISHNDTYKEIIWSAKKKRADRLMEESGLSFSDREPTVTELKVMVDRLSFEKNQLSEKNRGLENIMKQAEIEDLLERDKPVTNEPISIDRKLIGLLEKLLILGSDEAVIAIEKGQGRKSSQVFFEAHRGREFLCYVDDLKDLNITFGLDGNGRFVIKEKGLLDG